eukprot:m.168896 g.168896  ORF g.168896 m.168896 type:complete len:419 (+) comp13471_c0_seq9:403-1659(+)
MPPSTFYYLLFVFSMFMEQSNWCLLVAVCCLLRVVYCVSSSGSLCFCSHLVDECFYLHESYWSYELCFNRHVRQFHTERSRNAAANNDKLNLNFILGTSASYEYDITSPPPENAPSSFFFNKETQPYFSITHSHGDVCDLTGEERFTEVRFICNNEAPRSGNIVQIKETSSCQYLMVFETSALCGNKDFRVEKATAQQITCVTQGNGVVPKGLAMMQEEDALLKKERKDFVAATNVITQKNIRRVQHGRRSQETGTTARVSSSPSTPAAATRRPPRGQLITKKMFKGSHCFQGGGGGWWNYELCPNKHAFQFHKNEDGSMIKIFLGRWDESVHRQWYRKMRPDDETKDTLSLFMDGGDVCDETNKPRSVVVKMVCKQALPVDRVIITLTEPSQCNYVLKLKSRIVCDLMEDADDDGVF